MVYYLKNNENGNPACYETALEITKQGDIVTFKFTANHSERYCAFSGYNKLHCFGDACEIFIGNDDDRKTYYEIEISPKNELMLAKMIYVGERENGEPIIKIQFIKDCFLKSSVELIENGYIATITLNLNDIKTGDNEVYFNAYRLETDGGEKEKHLFALSPTMARRFHRPDYYVYLKDYV